MTKIEYDKAFLNVIPQICNDIGKYGAGLSGALANKWCAVEELYLDWYNNTHNDIIQNPAKFHATGILERGQIQFVYGQPGIIIVNMIAQKGVRSRQNTKPIDYDALKQCMVRLSKILHPAITPHNIKIYCPKIGTGLAGGDWQTIEDIILDKMIGFDITFVDFEN